MNRLQAPARRRRLDLARHALARPARQRRRSRALIADCAVTGATSNPTIFAKAITGSDRYDDQLRAAVAPGIDDPQELFFALALDDVRRAADLLRAAYDASDGRDGFVSFECTPDLADDTEATVDQALELWRRARPAERDDQGARHRGRDPRHRGAHRPRGERQRHAAVLARALRAGHRRLPRAASSGALRPASPSTRSPRWPPSSSRVWTPRPTPLLPAGSRPPRPRRDRQRPPRLRALPRALRRRALARAARRRRPPAAAAVGQHRHQGPHLLRRALRRGADRPRTSSTRCRRPPCARSPTTATWAARSDADAAAAAETLVAAAGDAGIDLAAITTELEREGVRSFCDSYHELLDCIEAKKARIATGGGNAG